MLYPPGLLFSKGFYNKFGFSSFPRNHGAIFIDLVHVQNFPPYSPISELYKKYFLRFFHRPRSWFINDRTPYKGICKYFLRFKLTLFVVKNGYYTIKNHFPTSYSTQHLLRTACVLILHTPQILDKICILFNPFIINLSVKCEVEYVEYSSVCIVILYFSPTSPILVYII